VLPGTKKVPKMPAKTQCEEGELNPIWHFAKVAICTENTGKSAIATFSKTHLFDRYCYPGATRVAAQFRTPAGRPALQPSRPSTAFPKQVSQWTTLAELHARLRERIAECARHEAEGRGRAATEYFRTCGGEQIQGAASEGGSQS